MQLWATRGWLCLSPPRYDAFPSLDVRCQKKMWKKRRKAVSRKITWSSWGNARPSLIVFVIFELWWKSAIRDCFTWFLVQLPLVDDWPVVWFGRDNWYILPCKTLWLITNIIAVSEAFKPDTHWKHTGSRLMGKMLSKLKSFKNLAELRYNMLLTHNIWNY